MKPLSFVNYVKNNITKSIAMVIALIFSVVLIFVTQMIFFSVLEGPRLGALMTDRATFVYPANSKEFGKLLNEFKEDQLIDRALPITDMSTDYFHFFGAAGMNVYFVKYQDMDYVMNKLGLRLKEGVLPKEGSNEILLDWRMANNKGKKLGDYFGKSADKSEKVFGKYKIVGLLEGESITAICPLNQTNALRADSIMVFPKEGRLKELNSWIRTISPQRAGIWTKEKADIQYFDSVEVIDKIRNFTFLGIIFVMAFAAGNSCYAHYFSRRYEFALLQAMGYTRSNITLRTISEITAINAIGFIGGLLLSLIIGCVMDKAFFIPHGYPFKLFEPDGMLKALTIPISTAIFGIIPSIWLLSRIDPIIIMDKFE